MASRSLGKTSNPDAVWSIATPAPFRQPDPQHRPTDENDPVRVRQTGQDYPSGQRSVRLRPRAQHPERDEKMTNCISTGSIYWISDEEIHILEEKATNGDKNSAFKLYQYHMFVSLDQDLEFKWLKIAAKNGHPIAQFNLADLFFTQDNKEKAIFWAKKAHRNGAKLPEELKILINID